ncbi:helix-turn-helix domain-containing protein [Streptomyces sp. NPDC049813]|uniref:helix-turn-helix domain-containing protein n=1 Tax=Streptomyces sp. NPDC049813 TaxID=3365597 RepID=UPI0037BC2AF8
MADDFAEQLRALKDRSGLSYGTLAKRLHTSTSTLHRYCNGTAVPNEYAPVERFARACKATPEELVALHRHWILADAGRGASPAAAARGGTPAGGKAGAAADPEAVPGAVPGADREAVPGAGTQAPATTTAPAGAATTTASAGAAAADPAAGPAAAAREGASAGGKDAAAAEAAAAGTDREAGTQAQPAADASAGAPAEAAAAGPAGGPATAPQADGPAGGQAPAEGDVPGAVPPVGGADPGEPVVTDGRRTGAAPASRTRRRRTLAVAVVTAAAVVAAVVLAVDLSGSGDRDPGDRAGRQPAGATATTDGPAPPPASASASASPSGKPSHRPSASASVPPSARASRTGGTGGGAGGSGGGTLLNVATRPYVYDSPCSQHFLVDSRPEQVGPPAPTEQDAPRWAAAYGAVSADEQEVALTLQGTGSDTVVLEKMHVRVLGKAAPLAWNDYSMGVGCGGNVFTKSFDVDLDSGSPTVTAKNGQRDFPYKVSESDPEVFYVTAHTKAHDVRWDLTIEWSSGARRGTAHIDNNGVPFRTSAATGRPGYDYPLGGSEWIAREEQTP